jgi:outer membrane protein assembly factor BamB
MQTITIDKRSKTMLKWFVAVLFIIGAREAFGAWFDFRANPQHNGLSEEKGVERPVIKWRFEGEGIYMFHTPMVGEDGTIYVMKGTGDYKTGNDTVYAVTPDGKEKWLFSDPRKRFAPITLSTDSSTLYILAALMPKRRTKGSYLLAVDTSEGKLKWEMKVSDSAAETWGAHVVTDSAGRIYVYGGDTLAVFEPGGKKLWSYKFLVGPQYKLSRLATGPTLSIDESVVYILNRVGRGIYAFEASTGKVLWHNKIECRNDNATPTVAPDGTIYISDHGTKQLYALDPDGKIKWKHSFKDEVDSPCLTSTNVTVGRDGTLYADLKYRCGGPGGWIFALDPKDGSVKWRFTFERGLLDSPMSVDRDGNIYIGIGDGYLYSLNPEGNVNWKLLVGFEPPKDKEQWGGDNMTQIALSGPAISGGTIYIITGKLTGAGSLVAVGKE